MHPSNCWISYQRGLYHMMHPAPVYSRRAAHPPGWRLLPFEPRPAPPNASSNSSHPPSAAGALEWGSTAMPCLAACLVLLFPRVAIVVLYLFTNFLERAYHGMLLPLLGFLFLPLTTIVYAYMVNSGISTNGAGIVWVVLAVLIDLGAIGGGYRSRRS